jgi:rhodanese-related sulfurtransferase
MTMKNLKILLTIVVLSLMSTLASAADAPAAPAANKVAAEEHPYKGKLAPKLSRAEVDKLLEHPEKIIFIDLRRPDEHTEIGGFPVFLSIQAKNLEASLDFIPKDRQIITVSNHAGRAGAGADLLVSKGFNVIGAVGVQDYEAAGGKLTKIVPPQKKPDAAPKSADATNPSAATKTADSGKQW